MTDTSLRTRIAAVMRLHQWRATVRTSYDDPVLDCSCGIAFGGGLDCQRDVFDCHREHVADAVIRELEGGYVWASKSRTLAEKAEKALPGHKIVVTKTRSDEKQSLLCFCGWESGWGTDSETRTEHSLHQIEARKAFKYGEHYGI